MSWKGMEISVQTWSLSARTHFWPCIQYFLIFQLEIIIFKMNNKEGTIIMIDGLAEGSCTELITTNFRELGKFSYM